MTDVALHLFHNFTFFHQKFHSAGIVISLGCTQLYSRVLCELECVIDEEIFAHFIRQIDAIVESFKRQITPIYACAGQKLDVLQADKTLFSREL